MEQFTFIALLIIFGGLIVLFISLNDSREQAVENIKGFEPFCGTENPSEGTYEGKQIFNANCAACHKLDKIMIGPALRNISQKYDSITITKFLHGDKTLIESKGYNNICVDFPQLTAEDIYNLMKYTQ